MLKNYLTIALRNLTRNRVSALINIGGLALGMAVAILIGLWVYDECTFNRNFANFEQLGKLFQNVKFDKTRSTYDVMPIPLAAELRTHYPDFQAVSLASQNQDIVLAIGEKKISASGAYAEPGLPEMLTLNMLAGNRQALKDPRSILLSRSLATNLFGQTDPMGQTLRLGAGENVTVAGIYRDLPANCDFHNYHFLAPWELYTYSDSGAARSAQAWDNNSYQLFAQLKPGASFAAVSARIKEIRMLRNDPPAYHPEFFVFPMRRWHLYDDFYDGVNIGGLVFYVWLFSIIGIFVLLLACINFMNLSTARSERRAKEVGIRKSIGSLRTHLILQFLTESVLVATTAFFLALLLAWLSLPFFNDIAGKQMGIPWYNPWFWLAGAGFSGLTGLIAGSYPAGYLSSFRPVTVLKGTFKAGRMASIPRKILVVLQFTVSVSLVIGTLVVLRQLQYARGRSTGYDRNGLIETRINSPNIFQHAAAIRTALLGSGAVTNFSASSFSITVQYGGTTAFSWPGKRADQHNLIMSNVITPDFGKTIGWQVLQGRDFSRAFGTDSSAIIINETAQRVMELQQPIGATLNYQGRPYHVIGVTRDMIRESPFKPVNPTFYVLGREQTTIQMRLSPQMPAGEAFANIGVIFKRYNPSSPFVYTFVDQEYGKKFQLETRIGKLATSFAALAIFISCLGLYGLIAFVAERRTHEIGVRKVLGASVFNVWGLLTREFMILVGLSLLIAIPLSWYYMHHWLMNYDYRTPLSWWIFAAAAAGAIVITLATISVQAIKAALANPVKSIRTE